MTMRRQLSWLFITTLALGSCRASIDQEATKDWIQATGRSCTSSYALAQSVGARVTNTGGEAKRRVLLALGESTHGVAEFEDLNLKVASLLGSKAGNTVLLIEGAPSIWDRVQSYVSSGTPSPSENLSGLSRSLETLSLIDSLRTLDLAGHHVEIYGIDPYNCADELRDYLQNFLANHDTVYYESAYAIISRSIEEICDHLLSNVQSYFQVCDSQDVKQISYFPRLALQSIQLQKMADKPRESAIFRDSCMAANVLYIYDNMVADNFLLFAHNGHIARDAGRMGSFLSAKLGSAYSPIAKFYGSGCHTGLDLERDKFECSSIEPAPRGSLEGVLASLGKPFVFVSFVDDRGRRITNSPLGRMIEYTEEGFPLRPSRVTKDGIVLDEFDGIAYFDSVSCTHQIMPQ